MYYVYVTKLISKFETINKSVHLNIWSCFNKNAVLNILKSCWIT